MNTMNTMNRGIAYTICVTALDTSKVYTATLRNAATNTSVSVAVFFVGDKAYFYFAPEVTATMQVGVYQLNVYDPDKQEMLYTDAYTVLRETGLNI